MFKNKLLFTALGLLLLTIACDDEVTPINPEGDARYRITFNGMWTEADHGPVPGNAHFTKIIGMTHNASVRLFEEGTFISSGMEQVAETGDVAAASSEIDAHISAGNAFSKIVISVSSGPLGTAVGEFTISEEHPYISLATMIAPSPDWFTGIHDFKLFDNGVWVSDVSFQPGSYDAGTEDGDQFSLENPSTNPVQPISPLSEGNASSLANGTPGVLPVSSWLIEIIE